VNAKGLMLAGLGMAALGGLLTLGSQSGASENGGTYYVFTGLMAFGGFNFLRGLYFFAKEQGRPSYTQPRPTARSVQPTTRPSPSSPTFIPAKTATTSGLVKSSTAKSHQEDQHDRPELPNGGDGGIDTATRIESLGESWAAGLVVAKGPGAPSHAPSSSMAPLSPSPAPAHLRDRSATSLATPDGVVANPSPPPPPPPFSPPIPQATTRNPDPAASVVPADSERKARKAGVRLPPLGIAALVSVLLGLGGAVLYLTLEEPSPANGSSVGATAKAVDAIAAPEGFTASQADVGGETIYTSTSMGFSIALPDGWAPSLDGGPSKKALFNAFDRDPSYNVGTTMGTPQLLMIRVKYLDFLTPRKTFQVIRASLQQDPHVNGKVEMYRAGLPAGSAEVFRAVRTTSDSRKRSMTTYWVLHGDRWYLLTFGVPASKASSYLPVFSDIAESLRFV
jgi:hypothetical protein